jgi:glyoxylase-like metal-dependent hydrolase (beta-lactamase superfamily II)
VRYLRERAGTASSGGPHEGTVLSLEEAVQIVAGISAISALGHTPGHIAVSIISEGNELLYLSDTLLHPIHAASPDWHAVIDVDPAGAARTKRLLLDRAASTGSTVLAFHFPFPGVGHVIKAGDDRWRWRPAGGEP